MAFQSSAFQAGAFQYVRNLSTPVISTVPVLERARVYRVRSRVTAGLWGISATASTSVHVRQSSVSFSLAGETFASVSTKPKRPILKLKPKPVSYEITSAGAVSLAGRVYTVGEYRAISSGSIRLYSASVAMYQQEEISLEEIAAWLLMAA